MSGDQHLTLTDSASQESRVRGTAKTRENSAGLFINDGDDVRLITAYHSLIRTNDIESGYIMRRESIGETEWLWGTPAGYSAFRVLTDGDAGRISHLRRHHA